MNRRNFLHHAAITFAAVISPVGASAFASDGALSAAIPESLMAEIITNNALNYTIVSATTQAKVDAGVKAMIEHRVGLGRDVSVYADQALSDAISAPKHPRAELWIARNDPSPGYRKDHPIHESPELRFFARLRNDPDTIAIQHFAEGCRFPKFGSSPNHRDMLATSFMSGHSVITGMVVDGPEAAARLFANSVTDYQYRYDLDKIRLVHNGVDRSQEFRTSLLSAWG